MKRQRKYHTREEVLKDFNASERRRIRLLKKCEVLEAEAEMLRDSSAPDAGVHIKQLREEADKCAAQAERIENTRQPKLKRALDEVDTGSLNLPGYETRQVVLRPLEKR